MDERTNDMGLVVKMGFAASPFYEATTEEYEDGYLVLWSDGTYSYVTGALELSFSKSGELRIQGKNW